MPPSAPRPASATSGGVWFLFGLHCFCLFLIVFALTPMTYSLDDIKKTLFWYLGPALGLIGLLLVYLRQVALPPKPILYGLLAYLGVLLVSTLTSAYSWIGWIETLMYWSAAGFFLSAMAIGSRRRTSEWMIRFLVIQIFITTVIGLFLFDSKMGQAGNSGIERLYAFLYGTTVPDTNATASQSLLYTFLLSRSAMQSTILSRDFYAAICTLYLPFALLLMLDPGAARRKWAWMVLGGVTALLTAACVYFCKSKGEYIFGLFSYLLFIGTFFFVRGISSEMRRIQIAVLVALNALVLLVAVLNSPELIDRFKTFETSVQSRGIIWAGSLDIFKHHPILGGGPGTFRIYFPLYRAPNYFEHEISNVTLFSHNYFLDLLSETGVLGFAAFMTMLGGMAWLGVRCIFRHPDARLRVQVLAVSAGLIAMFGSNATSPNGRWVIGASSLWTVMGLLAGLLIRARDESGLKTEAPVLTPAMPRPAAGLQWSPRALAVFAVLALAGVIYQGYGLSAGTRYFKAQQSYLSGLQYMEFATRNIQNGAVPRETVQTHLEQAALFFEESVALDPTAYSTYYKLGSVYTTIANMDSDAFSALAQKSGVTVDQLSSLLYRVESYLVKAIQTFRQLDSMWPHYAELDYNLSVVNNMAERMLRIGQSLDLKPSPALSALGTDPAVYENQAIAYAVEMRRMSIKPEVANLLAQQYLKAGRNEDAIQVYRGVIPEQPTADDEPLLLQYYQAAVQAADFKAQGQALENLWLLHPLDDGVLDQFLTLAREHQLDDALGRVLDRLETQNPVDPRIAEGRLEMAIHQKDSQAAARQMERYRQAGGNDPAVIASYQKFVTEHASASPPPAQP